MVFSHLAHKGLVYHPMTRTLHSMKVSGSSLNFDLNLSAITHMKLSGGLKSFMGSGDFLGWGLKKNMQLLLPH